MIDRKETYEAPFVCRACGWTDMLALPDGKPATDIIGPLCCSGCGQDDMTSTRLYGVEDLRPATGGYP